MRVKAKTWGVIGKNQFHHCSPLHGGLLCETISNLPNPNCRPYSSPHQVPKHKMLWHIEKGTLREVGKIDA
eukprot:GDKH01002216.1.p2 GENE.GDKH01002216.1~~GDKH01002216.1.p2  ORF type:complete len:71 (+),score=2.38 GDKH01002216.1:663-875(+)